MSKGTGQRDGPRVGGKQLSTNGAESVAKQMVKEESEEVGKSSSLAQSYKQAFVVYSGLT